MKYCKCENCKNCCKGIPGIPLPDEVVKIAEFLNIPLSKCLEEYFIVGWRVCIEIKGKTYNRIEFVYPARQGWNNKIEDWDYPFPEGSEHCLFLDNGLCKVNPVKPFECLKSFGCKIKGGVGVRDNVLLIWDKARKDNKIHPEIKDFIKRIGG